MPRDKTAACAPLVAQDTVSRNKPGRKGKRLAWRIDSYHFTPPAPHNAFLDGPTCTRGEVPLQIE